MKSYTDIEQSKKLAEILPKQTADFHFKSYSVLEGWCDIPHYRTASHIKDLPCWSLAALLDVYPMCVGRDLGMFCCWVNHKSMCSSHFDNPVDACVDMIITLKERKLIYN